MNTALSVNFEGSHPDFKILPDGERRGFKERGKGKPGLSAGIVRLVVWTFTHKAPPVIPVIERKRAKKTRKCSKNVRRDSSEW